MTICTKNEKDCLFLIIYKDYQTENTIFWSVLNLPEVLQILLYSLICTSISMSNDKKRVHSYWVYPPPK